MIPVSCVNTGTVQSLTEVGKLNGIQKIRRPEKEEQDRFTKPVMDEYIPEGKQPPADGPKKSGDVSGADDLDSKKEAEKEEKKSGKKTERCVGNTDKVDREIEKLKKKQKELKQKLNTETDENKIKDLKGKLAQVEQELRQKDNDGYRRQHTVFT